MTMHDGVKKFQIKSKIGDDSQFIRQREIQEKILDEQMREAGYIPVLDLGPFWSTAYDDKENYDSTLTMYATYVGKRKACQYLGVDGAGHYYPNSTQKSKLKPS